MLGYDSLFVLRLLIIVIVIALVAFRLRGWSRLERAVMAVAVLAAILALSSLLSDELTDAAVALVAAGVSLGLLALARSGAGSAGAASD